MTRRAVPWLVYGLGLCLFVPWFPLPFTQHYEHWMHVAFAERRQFGSEIHATYGPLGFIGLPFYHGPTYALLIAGNIALFVVAAAFLGRYWQTVTDRAHVPGWWVTCVLVLPAFLPFVPVWTPALLMPYVLINALVLASIGHPAALSLPWQVALGSLLAVFVLMKGTFIALAFIGAVVIAWHDVAGLRRTPSVMVAFVVALAGLWILTGQRLGHLGAYITGSFDIVNGYKDGMSLQMPGSNRLALVFGIVSVWIWAMTSACLARRLGRRAALPSVVLGATLFVVFQHGFIRGDIWHTLPSCLGLVSLALLAAPALVGGGADIVRSPVVVATVLPSVLPLVVSGLLHLGAPSLRILIDAPANLWSLLARGRAPIEASLGSHLRDAARDCPLPEVKPPVDSSAVDFGLSRGRRTAAMVRPSVTPYMAVSPALSRLNREYVDDPAGPATLVVSGHGTLDDSFPAGTDSPSILAMKAHFDLKEVAAGCLILERATPRTLDFAPLARLDVRFDETVHVPAGVRGPVWALIAVDATTAGRLFATLYKPARTTMIVTTPARTATFRLTASTAHQGIILSPLLDGIDKLKAFYGAGSLEAESEPVTSFRLVHGSRTWWYFRDRIQIEIFEVGISAASESTPTPTRWP